ncbi:MAG: SRPBCC family protein [Nocardioidaceae bacterium]
MDYETSVEVKAPADAVWNVLADPAEWPRWSASTDSVEMLDGSIGPGKRAKVSQPRMRPMTWTVTEYVPGSTFTWTSKSGGVTTVAYHEVSPLDGDRSRLVLGVQQSGVLVPLTDLLLGKRIREYVDLEAAGHKARAEQHTG